MHTVFLPSQLHLNSLRTFSHKVGRLALRLIETPTFRFPTCVASIETRLVRHADLAVRRRSVGTISEVGGLRVKDKILKESR